MKWQVAINTSDYSLLFVKLIEESEQINITMSGVYLVDVEAMDEEAAYQKAILKILTGRIGSLESMLRDSRSSYESLKSIQDERMSKHQNNVKNFLNIIRDGELTIVNTGMRILGTWFARDGMHHFELDSNIGFGDLIEAILESYPFGSEE